MTTTPTFAEPVNVTPAVCTPADQGAKGTQPKPPLLRSVQPTSAATPDLARSLPDRGTAGTTASCGLGDHHVPHHAHRPIGDPA